MGAILVLQMLLLTLLPYIICVILVGIIIWLIKTKLIKSKILKILIILSIIFCICVILCNITHEKPNDLYIKMKEITDNQSLVGLSKEEVVLLLGKPMKQYISEDENSYKYYAGHIGKGLFVFDKGILFDTYIDYVIDINFDENGEVESTSMRCIP